MMLDFGLGLSFGPEKGKRDQWVNNLDEILPKLENHFRSLWMTDHFFWEDDPTYEAWTVLSYLAGRYPKWEIGPMVLGQSYRNPALLAKMGATLQELSHGRFIMGIGAGWKEDEYRAYGYEFPSAGIRIEELEDTLEILQRLWTESGKITYQGKHYRIDNAYCEPKPNPIPPIMVGGGGVKTMRLAAQYGDWWNLPDVNLEDYATKVITLHEHCNALNREPETLRLTWFGRIAVGKTQKEAEARGGEKFTIDNAFVGTPEQIVEQMTPFVELGVTYFMTELLGLPDEDVIGMVTEDILPKLYAIEV